MRGFMKLKIISAYKESKKSVLIVYLLLRFLVIVTLIRQAIIGNYDNVFSCFLTLILFVMPFLLTKKFKIEFPSLMEIIILLFIFSAEILGEIQNFYGIFSYWDTILHTINGFICAGIGFSLIDLLNNNDSIKLNLSPFFLSLVAFCFSMTIGVLWEFFEYGIDKVFLMDMQKDRVVDIVSSVSLNEEKVNKPIIVDNIEKSYIITTDDLLIIENGYLDIGLNDTMEDLIVNFIGALIFCFFGFLYVNNREKYKFTENFIVKKSKKEK